MNHVKALLIKFVMIALVLGVILSGIYGKDFNTTLLISAILTIGAYIIGDLLIFRNVGNRRRKADQTKRNLIATISDAFLAFFIIWFLAKTFFAGDMNMLTASFISSLIIAAGEWFFHKYLDRHVFD